MAGNVCIQCNNCGHIGWSKKQGSFLITIILAWFFLIPAIIYEVWRSTGLGVCSHCGNSAVIPSSGCNVKDKNFQLNIAGIVLAVISIVGAFFFCVYVGVNTYYKIFPTVQLREQSCFTEGMHYFEENPKQKPTDIENHMELVAYVGDRCKGSSDGSYHP